MTKSARTKQCKRLSTILTILHILCLFGPFLYFIPHAFAIGTAGRKLALSMFLVIAVCLSVFSIITSAKTRGGLAKSVMWLFVLGITLCLNEVKGFIYLMSIIAIIDELIITKLLDKYKTAYLANREIDRRK